MLKKFLMMFVMALLFLNTGNVSFAEMKEIFVEGTYRLGDRDNRETAKQAARDEAERKIVEKVWVSVESYSESNNFELITDKIKTTSRALMQIKDEDVDFYENGTVCKVCLWAIVDVDSVKDMIGKIIIESEAKKIPAQKKSSHEDDITPEVIEKIFNVAGIYKYNGHYYKIFDEGLNWFQANERCKNMGGHLVTITSKTEQMSVQNMLFLHENNFRKNKNFYWTGGFNINGNDWKWITLEDFDYANWNEGEPNNDLGNEYIMTLYASGKWNDCPAEGIHHIPGVDFFYIQNSGFICEWESLNDIKNQ